jgi:hypothetical protein
VLGGGGSATDRQQREDDQSRMRDMVHGSHR